MPALHNIIQLSVITLYRFHNSVVQLRIFCATSDVCVRFLIVVRLRMFRVRFHISVCDFVFVCATSYSCVRFRMFCWRLRILFCDFVFVLCDFIVLFATSYCVVRLRMFCATSQSHSKHTYTIAQTAFFSHKQMKSRTPNEVSHTNTKSQAHRIIQSH